MKNSSVTGKLAQLALAGAMALSLAAPANAAAVLHQTAQGSYTTNVLFGSQWSQFTGYMSASHALSSTVDFSSLAQLQSYDAVWVDQELGNALSAAEISALSGYAAGGGRIVMIAENNLWSAWSASLMAVVGGTSVDGCSNATGSTLVANTLTQGVATVKNVCGSTLNPAANATNLFSNNMAALYAVGAGEVLVIADSNWNDNNYIGQADNRQFAQNVVAWLGEGATSLPEPGSISLAVLALGGLAMSRRRKA